MKLNAAGSALTYATFLGGSGYAEGRGIAIDASGAAYVTGYTSSSDFPTTPGAFDTSFNGGYYDAFVVKLNATGSALTYATFLGGSDWDEGWDIAIDSSGAAYVTGGTSSSDFPTTPGAFDTSFNGNTDAFVVKLNAAGSALTYATFLGGGGSDWGYGIAIDSSGAAYVTGGTSSSDFPTTPGAFDTSYNGGYWDAFVVKLNATGSALTYATFLGGSGYAEGRGIAIDASGAAYVTGHTYSSDFPTTPGAFDTSYNGNDDAFIVKLNAAGSALTYATFLGGGDYDEGRGIAIDASGAAYVTGETSSSDFPTTPGAFDTNFNGGLDAFVVKLGMGGNSGRIPVVIVPGYFATFCLEPVLKCGWSAKMAEDVYQSLIDAFISAGYQLNQNLFIAFYDWTRPNDQSADRLATLVNQAALNSPNGKVHIVTHSNGANVARSYIQRPTPSKVDTLVLIAPPTMGVVRAYPPWEGGDLSQENLGLFRTPLDVVLTLRDPLRAFRGGSVELFNAIHLLIPSMQELIPVGAPFLYIRNSDGTTSWQNPSQMVWRNTFLESLNSNVQNLYNDTSKVVVMASKGKTTHEQIRVRPYQPLIDGALWRDGKPEEYSFTTEGDGTILFVRAGLPSCSLPKCEFKGTYVQNHALPRGTDIVDEVRRDVLVAMNIPVPSNLSPVRARAVMAPVDELIYAVAGATTELFVQDPQGRQIGYHTDGSFVATIPEATYERVTADGKLVIVPNPLRGQYIVRVVALGSSSNFGGAVYSFATGQMQTEFTGTANVGVPQQYTHTYQSPFDIFLPFIRK